MDYTNEELVKIFEKAKANKKKLTHLTDKTALSTEEKMKISLCKHFVKYANENRMKVKDLSQLTSIPTSRISEMTNYKIDKFTVDQLVKNLGILAEHAPRIREYLLFLEQAVEIPAFKVTETRKLTKGLKAINEQGSIGAFSYV